MTSTKGLTPKQLHFARCVASGMSQAAAYREAYDTKTERSATVHDAASRVARRPEVKERIEWLIKQREQAVVASALSDREKVLSKLRQWLDTAEPADSNKIRAAELLGKSTGLFRDVIETADSKSSDDLLSDLEKLLEQSTATDDSKPDQEPLH